MNLSPRDTPPIRNIGGMQTDSDVLNKCLDAIYNNRATIDDCVRRYPEYIELGELLQAAVEARSLPKVGLNQASKSIMRQRILAHYDAQPVARTTQTRHFNLRAWVRPAIAIITTFIIIFAGGGSLLHAASQAVPGDT